MRKGAVCPTDDLGAIQAKPAGRAAGAGLVAAETQAIEPSVANYFKLIHHALFASPGTPQVTAFAPTRRWPDDQEVIMTDPMLVGVDGSESSRRAADFAALRAKAGGARLVVAYVIEWSPYSFNTPEENEQRHKRREEEIARAKAHLDPLMSELRAGGLDVESVVRHGHAAEVLSGLAGEHGAVQIFIGRRGVSRVSALLFGSMAGSLVQISPVPVTVVP